MGAHSFRVPEGFLKPIAWCAELAAMATKVLALVTSYDETTANEEAMAGAAQQFDDLLQVQTNPTVALHCSSSLHAHGINSQSHGSKIQ